MRTEGPPLDGRLTVPPGVPVAPQPSSPAVRRVRGRRPGAFPLPAAFAPTGRAWRGRRLPASHPLTDSACVSAEKALALLHLLAAFWYVMGLAAVQFPLIRGWRLDDLKLKVAAFEEATHYNGLLLAPGIIGSGVTGVFTWTQMDYNLVSSGWLFGLEAVYLVSP